MTSCTELNKFSYFNSKLSYESRIIIFLLLWCRELFYHIIVINTFCPKNVKIDLDLFLIGLDSLIRHLLLNETKNTLLSMMYEITKPIKSLHNIWGYSGQRKQKRFLWLQLCVTSRCLNLTGRDTIMRYWLELMGRGSALQGRRASKHRYTIMRCNTLQ